MTVPYNLFDTTYRDCWVTVDVAQLTQNAKSLQAFAERPILIAVKGNGYGHGYEQAAQAFEAARVRYLGVANYSEGLLLKQLGIKTPLLILGGMLPEEMKLAAAAGMEFFVFRPDHIQALKEMPKTSSPIRVHIKVDTGMGRLGCFPNEVARLGEELKKIPGVTIAGMATHFARASLPDNEHTNGQIEQFNQAASALQSIGIKPEFLHATNSSGTLYHPRARFDMVRMGVVAYGVPPSSAVGPIVPDGVKKALTWHARITSTRILSKGSKVSYGCEYEMTKDARVGVLPVGYVDGYHRIPKNINSVLVEGQERKILGRINMDQCMVDLDGFSDITGSEVVLLGKQGDKEISVEELARRWETNTYGVYSGIATRVPRRTSGL
ncbi:MAG: alanine racemase [Alphaproteobacteria bacterium]